MAKGKTIGLLMLGAAIGAAIGYVLSRDKDKRKEDMTKIKDGFIKVKDKYAQKIENMEHDIYKS